jgi:hypothetical protein
MSRSSQGKMQPDEVYVVKIHRDSRTGVAVSEKWLKEGLVHRVDGPAMVTRDAETGAVIAEFWMRNNQPHREDGPATASRDPVTGRIKRSAWFINGQRVPAPRRPQRTAKASLRQESTRKGPTG